MFDGDDKPRGQLPALGWPRGLLYVQRRTSNLSSSTTAPPQHARDISRSAARRLDGIGASSSHLPLATQRRQTDPSRQYTKCASPCGEETTANGWLKSSVMKAPQGRRFRHGRTSPKSAMAGSPSSLRALVSNSCRCRCGLVETTDHHECRPSDSRTARPPHRRTGVLRRCDTSRAATRRARAGTRCRAGNGSAQATFSERSVRLAQWLRSASASRRPLVSERRNPSTGTEPKGARADPRSRST